MNITRKPRKICLPCVLLDYNFMELSVHVILNSERKMLEIVYIMESGASSVFVAHCIEQLQCMTIETL